MESGGFPIDLILFGMIAAFLVLRLRSILGRRQGFERTAAPVRPQTASGPTIDSVVEPVAAPTRPLPDPTGPVGQALVRMQSVDRSFLPAKFLDGAEQAFRLIVAAFAAGDRTTLDALLDPETARVFESAIATREASGETQQTELRAIRSATIEDAALGGPGVGGTVADITVRFVSDQVTLTKARDGSILTGTDAVTELVDLWSFRRDLAQPDPAWRLTAARSA